MGDRIFGEIPGFPAGSVFESRSALHDAGVHRPTQAGISGSASEGADSIVLSGGYIDDEDHGDLVIYTGHGGRDLNTGKQIANQRMERGNKALSYSWLHKLPIRLIRGHTHDSPYSPSEGYRYDGLFYVSEYWSETGVDGYRIWRFKLRKDFHLEEEIREDSFSDNDEIDEWLSSHPEFQETPDTDGDETAVSSSIRVGNFLEPTEWAVLEAVANIRVVNALRSAASRGLIVVETLSDLRAFTKDRLLGLPNFGVNSWEVLQEALQALEQAGHVTSASPYNGESEVLEATPALPGARALEVVSDYAALVTPGATFGEFLEKHVMNGEIDFDSYISNLPEDAGRDLSAFLSQQLDETTFYLSPQGKEQQSTPLLRLYEEALAITELLQRPEMFYWRAMREETLEVVGERFDLTRERVRQIVKRDMEEFREVLGDSDNQNYLFLKWILHLVGLEVGPFMWIPDEEEHQRSMYRHLGEAIIMVLRNYVSKDEFAVSKFDTPALQLGQMNPGVPSEVAHVFQTERGFNPFITVISSPEYFVDFLELCLNPEYEDGWLIFDRGLIAKHRFAFNQIVEGATTAELGEVIEAFNHFPGCSSMEAAERAEWFFDAENWKKLDEQVYAKWGGSVVEKAFVILKHAGEPLLPKEIIDRIGEDYSAHSVQDRLKNDDRFIRTDKFQRVALKHWGLEEYSGIYQEICERIERGDGVASVKEILEEFTTQFGVSETSVRSYLAETSFSVVGDRVTFAVGNEYVPRPPTSIKDAVETSTGWGQKHVVEDEHFKGYSFNVSRDIAYANGVRPEDSLRLPVIADPEWQGEASIIWRQRSVGSFIDVGRLRELLERDFKIGDEIVLVPTKDHVAVYRHNASTASIFDKTESKNEDEWSFKAI